MSKAWKLPLSTQELVIRALAELPDFTLTSAINRPTSRRILGRFSWYCPEAYCYTI